jgi:hypothetical protein
VILAVLQPHFLIILLISRHHPIANQKRFNIAGVSKRHERALPILWRSSAVGAGPVGLGRWLHAWQLRSPPKAWRALQTVADEWGFNKREARASRADSRLPNVRQYAGDTAAGPILIASMASICGKTDCTCCSLSACGFAAP